MEPEYQLSSFSVLSGISIRTPDIEFFTDLAILILMLTVTALMSASEAAYFAFKPADIKKIKSDRKKTAGIALALYENPEKLLATILIISTILNIAFVFLAVYLSIGFFNLTITSLPGFILDLIIIAFVLLLFGQVMPKVYASRNRTGVALFMAYPLAFLQKILQPVTFIILRTSSIVKRKKSVKNTTGAEDSMNPDAARLDDDEKILKGIANFGNTNVSAIMCPRIDVTAIDIKSGFDKIIPVIINSGFSRIPVYSGSFDSVKGILYAKDVLPYTNNPPGFKWQSLLRPSYFVPETKKINDLLKEFQLRKIHMAIVIDEYGGASGIVTLEDILEEIVGEITDENDEDQPLFRKIDEKTNIFEGKILLNDFCNVYGIEEDTFSEVRGDSETLAGLMLELTGEIPQKDRIIKYGKFIFRIESVDRRRIKEIRVELTDHDDET